MFEVIVLVNNEGSCFLSIPGLRQLSVNGKEAQDYSRKGQQNDPED